MKKRFSKRVEQLLPWGLLVLSILALLLSLLLNPVDQAGRPSSGGTTGRLVTTPQGEANGEAGDEGGGETDKLTDRVPHTEGKAPPPSLKATLRGAVRSSYRGMSLPGESRTELDAWGEPVELLLSLYAVAATRRIVRFYLRREEERYRLSLEIKDE